MTQSYFLEDDNIAQKIHNDIGVWSSNIYSIFHLGPRAKSFSTMLTSSHVFGCDHPEVEKKYPNGFYSENVFFVPKSMYEKMLDCEPIAIKDKSVNSYWNLAGLIFIPFLTKMVEHRFSIKFNEEEKTNILFSALKHVFDKNIYIMGYHQTDDWFDKSKKAEAVRYIPQQYCSEVTPNQIVKWTKDIFVGEPVFVSNQDIANLADSLGMQSGDIIRNFTEDNSFIDYALLKNDEVYDIRHPFNKLIGKFNVPYTSMDLMDFDQESFKEFMENFPNTKAHIIYTAFNTLTYQIVKESKTEEQLIRNIGGIWSNLALLTSEKIFSALLNNLYDSCVKKFPSKNDRAYMSNDLITKIAHTINNKKICGPTMRSLIIENITKHADFCSTVRTMLFFQLKNDKKSINN